MGKTSTRKVVIGWLRAENQGEEVGNRGQYQPLPLKRPGYNLKEEGERSGET